MLDLKSWPTGMWVIVRKEIQQVGAQPRITDIDGNRYTAIATNQQKGQLASLEVRHRLRTRCEDRFRNAEDTGVTKLPLQAFAGNELWCHVVMLAAKIMARTQRKSFQRRKSQTLGTEGTPCPDV
jgi:hypothetical protein